MTDKERNLLELGEYYIIMAADTKKPYIDDDRSVYIYDTIGEALAFCKTHPGTYKDTKPVTLNQRFYCNKFYALGIEKIVLKKVNKEAIIIPLVREDIKNRQFFNHDGNAHINCLIQSKKKKYLRALKNDDLYCPLIIVPRLTKQYQILKYCKATYNNAEYMILFSTIQEFDSWNETQGKKWKPMKTSLVKIEQERHGLPVLINPFSDHLILSSQNIYTVIFLLTRPGSENEA